MEAHVILGKSYRETALEESADKSAIPNILSEICHLIKLQAVHTPNFMDCAEKCVEAFNNLPKPMIDEICKKLIDCAKEGSGLNEEFELPTLDSPLDILNYCWFVALYVDMESKDDEIAYAVEGEGEWGENIGFYISNDSVVYVGADYLDYMKNS